MRFWLGWLILLPFAGAWWLCYKIVDACIKKGGPVRLLGILVSLLVGGGSIVAGYFIGPIVGWFIMAVGVLVFVIGTWRSMVEPKPTKPQMEQEWLRGLVGKGQLGKSDQEKWENMWVSVKEEAKKMLQKEEIDDYERFSLVCSTLASRANDKESEELFERLRRLERKSIKEEAKEILKQGNIDNYKKKEWERFNWICYQLSHDPSDDATELLKQLKDLKYKQSKSLQ